MRRTLAQFSSAIVRFRGAEISRNPGKSGKERRSRWICFHCRDAAARFSAAILLTACATVLAADAAPRAQHTASSAVWPRYCTCSLEALPSKAFVTTTSPASTTLPAPEAPRRTRMQPSRTTSMKMPTCGGGAPRSRLAVAPTATFVNHAAREALRRLHSWRAMAADAGRKGTARNVHNDFVVCLANFQITDTTPMSLGSMHARYH